MILSLCLFPVLLLAGEAAALVTQTVRATGVGMIVAQDLAAAFEQAKKAALREAVEEAAGTLVSSTTRVEDFAATRDEILLQSAGYVRSFSIVEQGQVDARTFRVVLDAVVDLGNLHRQLESMNLLIEEAGNPPLLCLGQEYSAVDGKEREEGWGVVAAALEKALKAASQGFSLVDPGEGSRSLDEEAGLALARQRGAEVLIFGRAVAQSIAPARVPSSAVDLGDLGFKSAAAEVEVRALWVDTGAVVASLSRVCRAADTSFQGAAHKAIRQGVGELAPALVERLLENWRQQVYSGRQLQLVVLGLPGQLQAFERDFPLRVRGIDKLQPRAYSAGQAQYEARARNAAFQVARELSAKGLGALNVEILQVSPNTLKLKLSD